jgi:ethanolamine utilization protein EutN
MFLGKVIGNVVSTDKHVAYDGKKLLMVQKLDLYRNASGPSTVAIDYVGAGEGDIVLVGAAPGLASTVFKTPKAPIRELVMGVVDRVQVAGQPEYGNSVQP